MRDVRVAVIGLGFMGATHANAWTHIPGTKLTAVVSREERKLAGDLSGTGGNLGSAPIRLDFDHVRKYRTFDDALADPEIDAIDLCVPTDQHADFAIRAMRSGKHVLVEKPLALTVHDAERMKTVAAETGRVLMCAQVLRFFPAYVAARERMNSLGRIRSALFQRRCAAPSWSEWLGDPARSGGGAFDLLIHDTDFVRCVFGLPGDIYATGASDRTKGLDLITAQLQYEGFTVTITGGWHLQSAYPLGAEFTIVGEEGVLEYSHGALTVYRTASEPDRVILEDRDPFEAELTEFAACVDNGHESMVCPIEESVDAVRIMVKILAARQ